MKKVILRDFNNAICKVAMVPNSMVKILDSIDDIINFGGDETVLKSLYNSLDFKKVKYIDENHRNLKEQVKMYDGGFGF